MENISQTERICSIPKKVVVIIPSLNPDEKLLEVVQGLIAEGFEDILLVDDGSRSQPKRCFAQAQTIPGCKILVHAVNQGKGRALKTAFNYYLTHFDQELYAGVVTADADGQHLPADIRACADALATAPDRIVLGCRDFSEPSVPFKSRFGNNTTTAVFHLLYGKRISDTQTGLRALPNSFLAECLNMPGERFEYEIEMLICAVRSRLPIHEAKIATVYFDNNRETHFDPLRDSFRIYRVILASFFKYTLSSLSCFLIDIGLYRVVFQLLFRTIPSHWAIGIATVAARICSALINYSINRAVVFRSDTDHRSSLLRYILLCCTQMCASWLLVAGIYALLPIESAFIKMVVDSLLFIISYRVQAKWVFSQRY